MSGITLGGTPWTAMLTHLALYGLGAIVEERHADGPRFAWTPGMAPRPVLRCGDLDADDIAAIVQEHAIRHASDGSWLRERLAVEGNNRAVMSPRIAQLDDAGWRELRSRRAAVIDALVHNSAVLDLRLVGALGQPSYWSRNLPGEALQDDGASRLEMQPRNQGSEFVGTKLTPLAEHVAARALPAVRDGLTGAAAVDEVGRGKSDSRAPTGLSDPGPVDNALVWCALWGIAGLPVALRSTRRAATSAHLPEPRPAGAFVLPVWRGELRAARLRSLLASEQLCAAAGGEAAAPQRWLVTRAVVAVVRFPVGVFGSASAPERRALAGRVQRLDGGPR